MLHALMFLCAIIHDIVIIILSLLPIPVIILVRRSVNNIAHQVHCHCTMSDAIYGMTMLLRTSCALPTCLRPLMLNRPSAFMPCMARDVALPSLLSRLTGDALRDAHSRRHISSQRCLRRHHTDACSSPACATATMVKLDG